MDRESDRELGIEVVDPLYLYMDMEDSEIWGGFVPSQVVEKVEKEEENDSS